MAAPTSDIGRPDLNWGSWGQGLLTEWYETAPDLIWPQSVVTYGRMRHDPQVKAVLGAYKHPLMRATWVLDPDGCKPKVVQHVADDLGVGILGNDKGQGAARRRGVVWGRHLQEAFNYLVFGHMPFERRYTYDPQGVPHLTHLGARMPWTIAQMKIDQYGVMQEIEQTTQRDPIPAERLVWYVNDQEGSNWAGISMLRAAFGAWLLKHETWRVHATSIRRFGMGVPVVNAPPGATQGQVVQAQQLASSMRAGDSAGMGLPQGFTAAIQGITGSVPDALAFIKYLDVAVAKMVHAGLIELGQTDNGSRALGETFMDLFQLSLQSVADSIALTATSGYEGMPGIITDLVDQAYGEDEPAPRLVCTDVGENYEVSANALQSLTMSGVMTPDPALDEWARKTWRLPKRTDKWTPSSRGMPAGDSITPKTENALGYDGVPGAGGGQGPARDTARLSGPRNGGQPAGDGTQPQPAASGVTAKDGTRRQQEYIRASSWEPTQHQDDWEQALAHLLLQYRSVMSAQRTDLVDRVITAMESGQQQNLVLAAPAVGNGPDIVTQAMVNVARKAAQAMTDEAARQGVHIDLEQVRVDAEALGGTAQARSLFYSGWMAQQATAKALQVYGPTPEGMLRAADEVDRFLAGLSDQTLRDQLGAALTTAQNAGRFAVLKAAPQSAAHKVTYVASEFLDQNTCDHCRHEDGTEFDTVEAAEAAYPTGGFRECQGLLRCRGTVVAVWGPGAPVPGSGQYPYKLAAGDADPKVPGGISGGLTAKFDPLEKRDERGRWSLGHVIVFGQHSKVTPKQVAVIRDRLARHHSVSPGVVAHLSSVSTSRNLEQKSVADAGGLTVHNKKTGRSSVLLSTREFGLGTAGNTLDHEMGHVASNAAFADHKGVPQDPAYWRQLADSLGVKDVPQPTVESADAWVSSPPVRAALKKLGMPYAVNNLSEFQADMWREYAAGHPSPPARVFGDMVKRTLGDVSAKFHPDELRDGHGRWSGHGEPARNPSGRLAQQVPSNFTHPATGHRMGQTETGDTFEELFKNKGAHLLEAKFGGKFSRVSGGDTGTGKEKRNLPLDSRLDDTYGGELKTMNAKRPEQKASMKADAVARKNDAVGAQGWKPLLVIQVIDPESGRAELYTFPAFSSRHTKAMTYLGGYDFGPDDFKQAQEATGHWVQRDRRAKEQGL